MTSITFDSLKYFEKLKEAGVPEAQARVQATIQKEALEEIINAQEFATKQDLQLGLAELRNEIAETKHELLKWIIGIAFAQTALIVGVMAFL